MWSNDNLLCQLSWVKLLILRANVRRSQGQELDFCQFLKLSELCGLYWSHRDAMQSRDWVKHTWKTQNKLHSLFNLKIGSHHNFQLWGRGKLIFGWIITNFRKAGPESSWSRNIQLAALYRGSNFASSPAALVQFLAS